VAAVTLEAYPDLLKVRALPEWRFVGPRVIETTAEHLASAGLAPELAAATYGEPAGYLFDYQKWVVEAALRKERFAVFADCGLGKTPIQLDWARLAGEAHGGRTLILAPLQVVPQTIGEAARFYGDTLPIADLRDRAALKAWLDDGPGIGITNYEKIDGTTDTLAVSAVVIDESSVLKASMGVRRTSLVNAFRGVRWKLCCSATPAPNDRLEYAEHAYFLEVVRSTREFLAMFFVNRDGNWQLKHHGEKAFYRHLASWSVFMRSPAAYHFADNRQALPKLEMRYPRVDLTDAQRAAARRWERGDQPSLLGATPGGITSRTKVMQIAHGFELDGTEIRRFPARKPADIAGLVNGDHGDEQVIVWVTFDEEGTQLGRLIPDAVVISGKTPQARRTDLIDAFRRAGDGPRVLICKASMLGHGLNLQACRIQIFSSMSDSFERFYQAIRRSHRYGQTRPVIVYVPLTELDEPMLRNVLAKQATWEADAGRQEQAYIEVLRPRDSTERKSLMTEPQVELDRDGTDRWTLVLGDAVAHMPTMAAESMDLAVFSPPFANLFTYSSEAADMGNVRSDDEYRLQWEFFAPELFRIMKAGRVVAVHCMDVIRFAGAHGYRHTYDYPSDLRAGMERAGFRYHARIAIDKDPQVQATRTKDANLLFVTLKRNALDSHPQASECLLIFRKPGEAAAKVHADDISNVEWISWAHHIWYDIRATDVLNAALGKEHDDERHICPLQLGLIERCVRLWTNRDETVFSPFAGIGSEGVESLRWGRRFYGIELKRSYFDTARRFLTTAESDGEVPTLFDVVPIDDVGPSEALG
jgi:DNA modification methylase